MNDLSNFSDRLLVIEGETGPPPTRAECVVIGILAWAFAAVVVQCAVFPVLGVLRGSLGVGGNVAMAGVPLGLLSLPLWLALAAMGVRHHFGARCGVAGFFADRVSLVKASAQVDVTWREVVAYRDSSLDYVQLLRAGERLGSWRLAIPTRNEADRAAVLGVLADRVSREE